MNDQVVESERSAAGHQPHRAHWGWDGLAISASTLCLIHCLVLPVVLAFLPAIAEWADLGEGVHVVMLGIALPLSGSTLLLGWRRHHRRVPLGLGAAGLTLLVAGVLLEGGMAGLLITVTGSLTLTLAHIANLRATALAALATL
ncbi:MerC domain-containing protein [Sphingomonas sp.]|uniref:MerC domain-containing protein n=1 Tax=Sphingomonas sp. TaxID=28214 RepID=UPI0031D7785E